MQKYLFSAFALSALFSCAQEEELGTRELNKDNGIEVTLQVLPLNDSLCILKTERRVNANFLVVKTAVSYDTIPSLKKQTVKSYDENDNPVDIPKEYEFYVTVK